MPSDDFVAQVIDVMKMRVTFGKEIAAQAVYFFKTPESYDENMLQKRWNEESAVIIEELASRWAGVSDWNSEKLTEIFETFTAEKELPTGKVLAPLRLALTGVAGGPGVFDIAAIIGKKESLHRMELILKKTRL